MSRNVWMTCQVGALLQIAATAISTCTDATDPSIAEPDGCWRQVDAGAILDGLTAVRTIGGK